MNFKEELCKLLYNNRSTDLYHEGETSDLADLIISSIIYRIDKMIDDVHTELEKEFPGIEDLNVFNFLDVDDIVEYKQIRAELYTLKRMKDEYGV